jgi:hypothetical protein
MTKVEKSKKQKPKPKTKDVEPPDDIEEHDFDKVVGALLKVPKKREKPKP